MNTIEKIDTDIEKYCDRNSFYGKAQAYQVNDNVYLKSYDTVIAVCDMKTGDIARTWDGKSTTSTRHFKAFQKMLEAEGVIEPSKMHFNDYPYKPELAQEPTPKKSLSDVIKIGESGKSEVTTKDRDNSRAM